MQQRKLSQQRKQNSKKSSSDNESMSDQNGSKSESDKDERRIQQSRESSTTKKKAPPRSTSEQYKKNEFLKGYMSRHSMEWPDPEQPRLTSYNQPIVPQIQTLRGGSPQLRQNLPLNYCEPFHCYGTDLKNPAQDHFKSYPYYQKNFTEKLLADYDVMGQHILSGQFSSTMDPQPSVAPQDVFLLDFFSTAMNRLNTVLVDQNAEKGTVRASRIVNNQNFVDSQDVSVLPEETFNEYDEWCDAEGEHLESHENARKVCAKSRKNSKNVLEGLEKNALQKTVVLGVPTYGVLNETTSLQPCHSTGFTHQLPAMNVTLCNLMMGNNSKYKHLESGLFNANGLAFPVMMNAKESDLNKDCVEYIFKQTAHASQFDLLQIMQQTLCTVVGKSTQGLAERILGQLKVKPVLVTFHPEGLLASESPRGTFAQDITEFNARFQEFLKVGLEDIKVIKERKNLQKCLDLSKNLVYGLQEVVQLHDGKVAYVGCAIKYMHDRKKFGYYSPFCRRSKLDQDEKDADHTNPNFDRQLYSSTTNNFYEADNTSQWFDAEKLNFNAITFETKQWVSEQPKSEWQGLKRLYQVLCELKLKEGAILEYMKKARVIRSQLFVVCETEVKARLVHNAVREALILKVCNSEVFRHVRINTPATENARDVLLNLLQLKARQRQGHSQNVGDQELLKELQRFVRGKTDLETCERNSKEFTNTWYNIYTQNPKWTRFVPEQFLNDRPYGSNIQPRSTSSNQTGVTSLAQQKIIDALLKSSIQYLPRYLHEVSVFSSEHFLNQKILSLCTSTSEQRNVSTLPLYIVQPFHRLREMTEQDLQQTEQTPEVHVNVAILLLNEHSFDVFLQVYQPDAKYVKFGEVNQVDDFIWRMFRHLAQFVLGYINDVEKFLETSLTQTQMLANFLKLFGLICCRSDANYSKAYTEFLRSDRFLNMKTELKNVKAERFTCEILKSEITLARGAKHTIQPVLEQQVLVTESSVEFVERTVKSTGTGLQGDPSCMQEVQNQDDLEMSQLTDKKGSQNTFRSGVRSGAHSQSSVKSLAHDQDQNLNYLSSSLSPSPSSSPQVKPTTTPQKVSREQARQLQKEGKKVYMKKREYKPYAKNQQQSLKLEGQKMTSDQNQKSKESHSSQATLMTAVRVAPVTTHQLIQSHVPKKDAMPLGKPPVIVKTEQSVPTLTFQKQLGATPKFSSDIKSLANDYKKNSGLTNQPPGSSVKPGTKGQSK